MNKLRFSILFLAGISLLSCENEIGTEPGKDMGEIAVQLAADDSFHITTKAEGDGANGVSNSGVTVSPLPAAADFQIEIRNSKKVVKNDTYNNIAGKTFFANADEYTATATHGDASSAGFGAEQYAYFHASQTATLAPQSLQTFSLEAKMTKVMMSLSYGAAIEDMQYHEYYSVITSNTDISKSLKFTEDQKDFGFIPADTYTFTFHVTNVEGGTEKVFTLDKELTYAENTFVAFVVDLKGGSMNLSITLDETTTSHTLTEEISSDALPTEAPKITVTGTDSFEHIASTEPDLSTALSDMSAHILADGLISKCILTLEDNYLNNTLGLPRSIDLATATAEEIKKITDAGVSIIPETDNLAGQRLARIDLSGLAKHYTNASYKDMNAKFSVKVTDQKGKESETQNFGIRIAIVNASFDAISAGDVWAKRMTKFGATYTGDPTKMELQRKIGNGAWENISGDAMTIPANFTGLTPATRYQFRIMHDYKSETPLASTEFTTETAAQVENADMEDWTEWEYKGNSWGSDYYVTNYAPYINEDKYWDTNNSETTPNNTSPEYGNWKSAPTVISITGKSGKAAQLRTIGRDDDASVISGEPNHRTWGKLFISGTNGQAFGSRPSKMSFYYQYSPYNSDKFSVTIQIKNGSETIGTGSATIGNSVSSWTAADVNITYTKTDVVATSIYIEFISGSVLSDGKPMVTRHNDTSRPWTGSILSIDDISLIYE